ncbi:MAG: hypothetical protein ACR2RB_14300, partial [Gammaproteobacteria bacterium]
MVTHIYVAALLAFFATGADIYLGNKGLLPVPPSILLAAFLTPVVLSVLIKDGLAWPPLSRVLPLYTRNWAIIVPFVVLVLVALSLSFLPYAHLEGG